MTSGVLTMSIFPLGDSPTLAQYPWGHLLHLHGLNSTVTVERDSRNVEYVLLRAGLPRGVEQIVDTGDKGIRA